MGASGVNAATSQYGISRNSPNPRTRIPYNPQRSQDLARSLAKTDSDLEEYEEDLSTSTEKTVVPSDPNAALQDMMSKFTEALAKQAEAAEKSAQANQQQLEKLNRHITDLTETLKSNPVPQNGSVPAEKVEELLTSIKQGLQVTRNTKLATLMSFAPVIGQAQAAAASSTAKEVDKKISSFEREHALNKPK